MRTTLAAWAAAIGLAVSPVAALAQNTYDSSLRVGSALEVLDENGHQRNFTELAGKQGLIVAYGRQVDRCPVCQERLAQLNGAQTSFSKEGFNLAVVTPDSPEALKRFSSRRKLGIPLLSDPELETLKALSFYEGAEHRHDGDQPVVAVLDANGRLVASLSEAQLRGADVPEAVMAATHGQAADRH